MKTTSSELQFAPVPETAKPANDVRARWAWAAPTVWTERMLTALENGVKGGTWFSLIDKVYSEEHLYYAAGPVLHNQGAAGVDHESVEQFAADRIDKVRQLARALRDGTYRPQAIRRVHIPKPGSKELRPLGIPTVRDRVVQNALRLVLEPIFERDFAEHSYGFRPGRSCHDALRRVEGLIETGYHFVVDVDLKSYFDTIPHQSLMERVREKVSDGRVLKLIAAFLQARVMEGLSAWTPTQGAPQGAVLSPLLSNIYLNPLDHLLAESGFEMVRYADDFVILCRSQQQAEEALRLVRDWTLQVGLTIHPEKTRIVSVTEGFDFLGYHFRYGSRRPRKKSLDRIKAAIRDKTPRSSGRSLESIVTDLNRTLRGWFAYFRDSIHDPLRRLDQWIRMRLRRILRKRHRFRGYGRDADHRRWPNAYFARLGLFSLTQAHREYRQPSPR